MLWGKRCSWRWLHCLRWCQKRYVLGWCQIEIAARWCWKWNSSNGLDNVAVPAFSNDAALMWSAVTGISSHRGRLNIHVLSLIWKSIRSRYFVSLLSSAGWAPWATTLHRSGWQSFTNDFADWISYQVKLLPLLPLLPLLLPPLLLLCRCLQCVSCPVRSVARWLGLLHKLPYWWHCAGSSGSWIYSTGTLTGVPALCCSPWPIWCEKESYIKRLSRLWRDHHDRSSFFWQLCLGFWQLDLQRLVCYRWTSADLFPWQVLLLKYNCQRNYGIVLKAEYAGIYCCISAAPEQLWICNR